MKKVGKIRLVWHRKGDLRLHDNELYHDVIPTGIADATMIVSLYCLNPKDYERRPSVTIATERGGNNNMEEDCCWTTIMEGPHASRALLEALHDLKQSLRALGGDLILCRGNPLEIIPEMATRIQADEVVWSEVPGYYERTLSETLKGILLSKHDICFHTVQSYTLFHPNDLPYGQDAWTRLARPNQQQSKKTQKKKEVAIFSGKNDNGSTFPIDAKIGVEMSCAARSSCIDCSPERWEGLPRIMGDFRRAARAYAMVRPGLPPPTREFVQAVHDVTTTGNQQDTLLGVLPTIEELTGLMRHRSLFGIPTSAFCDILQTACISDLREHQSTSTNLPAHGETAARDRWDIFLSNHAADADRSLADTSNNQSAHISTDLALGTLSPRHVYWSVVQHQVQQDQKAHGNNNQTLSCQWLISHMEMRDYFLFSAFAADKYLYRLKGHQEAVHKSKQKRKDPSKFQKYEIPWKNFKNCPELFQQWALGQTGLPLVDAGMNELLQTGYCSNRSRQNMASVLTKDLHIDWRIGAEWFQFWLADHCVGANWGNWRYFGGVGGDPKNRHFRTVSQALRYDARGMYVQKWLPKRQREVILQFLQQKSTCGRGDQCSEDQIHEVWFRPWDFIKDWSVVVDPSTQYTWQDRLRLEETGSLMLQDS